MKRWLSLLPLIWLSACDKGPAGPEMAEERPPVVIDPAAVVLDNVVYTHLNASGNRVFPGRGAASEKVIDIPLSGKPKWLTAASSNDFSFWVAVLEDGSIQAFILRPDGVGLYYGGPHLGSLPNGEPPVLGLNSGGAPALANAAATDAAPHTAPVVLPGGRSAYLNAAGMLVLQSADQVETLDVDALPDARIVSNQQDELAVLTHPTTDYDHGVLGDAVEARAITIVQTRPSLAVVTRIDMPDQAVIEGVSPIWADLDGDGEDDLLITRSNNAAGPGAQVVAYKKTGAVIAEGPLSPGGWRHQLAVFQPQANAPLLIVDCQKPHVERILNFYQLEDGQFRVVGSKPGYSTHQLGLRNLDMALAGDFDGDGIREMIVPSTDFLELRSVILVNGLVEEKTVRAAGGKIATNFSAAELDGKLILGVGTENGNLRLWMD